MTGRPKRQAELDGAGLRGDGPRWPGRAVCTMARPLRALCNARGTGVTVRRRSHDRLTERAVPAMEPRAAGAHHAVILQVLRLSD
jgi:hypothetical protein